MGQILTPKYQKKDKLSKKTANLSTTREYILGNEKYLNFGQTTDGSVPILENMPSDMRS